MWLWWRSLLSPREPPPGPGTAIGPNRTTKPAPSATTSAGPQTSSTGRRPMATNTAQPANGTPTPVCAATARRAFQTANPCPATGLPTGPCPGYVVDHIIPLKRGSADDPRNMQRQTVEDARGYEALDLNAAPVPQDSLHNHQVLQGTRIAGGTHSAHMLRYV